MIQKALLGPLTPEEEVHQRLEQQQRSKMKGMTIQMPPLNTALVEVHKELAKVTRETKEIAEVCKRTTKASDQMHQEWSAIKNTNEEVLT